MKFYKITLIAVAICIASTSAFVLCGCVDDSQSVINGTAVLNTNKAEYFSGEEIYVSAQGDKDAWVGLYREKDNVKESESIRRYYVAKNGFVSGTTYAFKKSSTVNENRQAFKNIPRGKYKLVLFGDEENKKAKATVTFTVLKEEIQLPQAPLSMEYSLKNPTDGLADGTLKLKFPDNSFAEEVELYWADENGILNDYTKLAPFFITSNQATLEMYSSTIIPASATKLIAYSKNSLGVSEKYCEASLPKDCQFKLSDEVLCEFQVVSDVHIAIADTHLASPDAKTLHDAHFLSMCRDIVSVSPKSSGLFVVGDIANSGRESEWRHTKELLATVAGLPNVSFSLGNHDLYGGESYKTLAENFCRYAETDSVYYEKTVGGYHHLFLGSESKGDGLYADLSDAQLKWFDNRMSELTESEPNKPVFVYLHQSLYDTIAGSFPGQGWDGVVQDEAFRAIVAKYKQIYMFNGHSHWDMNTRGSMHNRTDGLPNVFNTASVAYLWSSLYVPTGEYLRGSQGYYVKVFADKVLVLGRDFENGKWIPSACFKAQI